MPYNTLPRPRACPKGKLPNRTSIPDDGHLGTHNPDGVSSGLPTSQERDHGGDHLSCNNGTAVYRSFYGRARSPGATYYSFSWRLFKQWWHHGGDLYFHRDYVLCGAHDYTRAGNRYHYCYTSDTDSCHGGGGERKSVTSGWSIRMSASPTTTATTARPR